MIAFEFILEGGYVRLADRGKKKLIHTVFFLQL
jgi:hypothetical protein